MKNQKKIDAGIMGSLDEKKLKLKKELDAIHNATRMVLFNSILNVLIKLPMLFISIHVTIERFYFASEEFYFYFNSFYIFNLKMFKMDFLKMIPNLSNFLLVVYSSSLLFFYAHFDKKIQKASQRLLNKCVE